MFRKKLISFIKTASILIAMAFVISFWFEVPVEVTVFMAVIVSIVVALYNRKTI